MINKISNFFDNYGRSLRATGRIQQAFKDGRPVKNGERVVSNQHIRDMNLVELLKHKYDLNDREDLSRILSIFKTCAVMRGNDVPSGYSRDCDAVQNLEFPWSSTDTSIQPGFELVAEDIDCYEILIDAQFPLGDEDEEELARHYVDSPESSGEETEPDGQDSTPIKEEYATGEGLQDRKSEERGA
ncbi:hypothetical protein BJ508DRAFT_336605 [Ascobolus immersus RN42]|uniref:Uncharacterized protein n=1 Tax=Ascobolus immersus RN42 TaxID=1160509 RepID=A0A3N4H801_ASCIM|nr:hypothetical protein BJ508DRAFT_336605 [Ascobolus immersus RN42]